MTALSIGDILMLSQTAWKIGRTFTAGRKNAPPEFLEVEAEINGLAKSLKLLAGTMFAEENDLLKKADQDTRDGFHSILRSCQRTIHDLDSLMDQYQVIKKTKTSSGFTVERSWSDLVVAQYQTMMWTTDGSNIKDLRYLLQAHTATTSLLKQAFESNDVSRLENVVSPMADKVDRIHHKSAIFGQQLDEATRVVKNIVNQSPYMSPLERRPSQLDASPHSQTSRVTFVAHEGVEARHSSLSGTATAASLKSPCSSPYITTTPSKHSHVRSARALSSVAASIDNDSNCGSDLRCSHDIPSKPDWGVLSPKLSPTIMNYPVHHELNTDEIESRMSDLEIQPAMCDEVTTLNRSATTMSQTKRFWGSVVQNSALLCDVIGTAVEYAVKVSSDSGSNEVKMAKACCRCRIAVIRKREFPADGKGDIQIMTSVWVISDDNTLRMELKIADGGWYVPYSSFFSPEKVSITVPCELKFYDVEYEQRPLKVESTNWINYVLESPLAAALFQNELMGRTLLRTYGIRQTLRAHEGLSGAFAYAEQMCGMENLRIWEDNETLAVIALIHFSPQFRDGYLAFYLNSTNAPIQVKDEGGKAIKIKGLNVPLKKRKSRKDSALGEEADLNGSIKGKRKGNDKTTKFIKGARMEFETELGKRDFLALIWQLQGSMRDLPPLSGVN
ncbi:hypothetical protein P280DRAFT_430454 [Massarina eburnea CBS 473.64]|uniref:Fungal N-terminal domain-containing protein n=1 Tax=Massarina eburnea CBS 473.64 TaxID=1395130 RepID=A0A6A6RXJ3_9PLEO|nr:hypothetical protein P280DRAFT_430454 [Massarina eburnea CBS 473.64]